MAGESWDTLHDPGAPESHWSTDNVGEAAPGVLSPMSWSIWGSSGDSMPRNIARSMGVFSAADHRDFARIVRPFYGRVAMSMEYIATIGDRMPGATGQDTVANMLGRVPETMTFAPTARRYPFVAVKLPRAMLTAPRGVRRMAPEVDAWWRTSITRLPELSLDESLALLRDGVARFDHVITVHSLALLSVVQPLLVELTKLVERSGAGDVGALSGSGGAEMAIVDDIWKASRGVQTIDEVVANHGFHGPLEGEISSHVWREDRTPLERMIEGYALRDDSENPALREEESRRRRPELQREVLAALPAARRPAARVLLRLAARQIPLRGVGKRGFLQSLDVARGAARRVGEHLADAGTLDTPDDVFNLGIDELDGMLPPDVKELVAKRAARREEYRALRLPGNWQGEPVPESAEQRGDDSGVITGIGASGGVAEGLVRVVIDPSFAEVEDGEILVTPTTDPSWASIMFLSAALVVDMGGALSHAAVVARELGIPCVVNTRHGSRSLRTGDRVRVDGNAGTVEVLTAVAREEA